MAVVSPSPDEKIKNSFADYFNPLYVFLGIPLRAPI
jgi:hypothetical protein